MKSRRTRHHSRRSFLSGAGSAVLALPWLESVSSATHTIKSAQRLAHYYVPIGVVRRNFFPGEESLQPINFKGDNKTQHEPITQLPAGVHPLKLTPTLLPLEKVQHKVTLITGLDRVVQNGSDVHEQCASCYLSSAVPYEIQSLALPQARTLDHIIADQIGNETPFRTLEFSCNSHKDNKESIYFDNISWYGTGHVAPAMRDPSAAYRRLFGTQEAKRFRNITDLVLEDARELENELGYADRQKFTEYFDSIRAIERQVDKLAQLKFKLEQLRLPEPSAVYLPRGEYIRLMGDLMIVALQSGLTNVVSMMVGPERWNTPYMFEGLFDEPKSHHLMSHNQVEYAEQLEQIDHFYMQQFAYIVEKLDNIQEADGTSLLDNTLFTYGSGLGDGATHQYDRLPIIVAGCGGGQFTTGKHLQCPQGTPLANLWLSQTRAMGIERERYADSTGVLSELFSVTL